MSFFLSGCATIKYIPLTDQKYSPKAKNAKILITTRDLDRLYEEIGLIAVESENGQQLRQALIRQARKLGADAIIRVEYSLQDASAASGVDTGLSATFIAIPYQMTTARGVAVVYIEEPKHKIQYETE